MSTDNGKVPMVSLSSEKSIAKRTKIPASRKADLYNPYPIQTYNGIKLPNQSTNQGNGLELYAYQLKVNAQPLYKSLQTARKVLMTQDWKVLYRTTLSSRLSAFSNLLFNNRLAEMN